MSYFDQKENTGLLEDDADYAIPVTPMIAGLSHAETCFPIVGVSRVGGRFFGAREEANGCGSAATQHSERGLVGDGAGKMGARRGWAGSRSRFGWYSRDGEGRVSRAV